MKLRVKVRKYYYATEDVDVDEDWTSMPELFLNYKYGEFNWKSYEELK